MYICFYLKFLASYLWKELMQIFQIFLSTISFLQEIESAGELNFSIWNTAEEPKYKSKNSNVV